MQNYLGDMTTRIRNGHRARLGAVLLHHSTPKLCIQILQILQTEGYIVGFQYQYLIKTQKPQIKVFLKYDIRGTSVIRSIFQVSKPSRRVFVALDSLWKPKTNFGQFILSTQEGLMVEREARMKNLGGEVLCAIY